MQLVYRMDVPLFFEPGEVALVLAYRGHDAFPRSNRDCLAELGEIVDTNRSLPRCADNMLRAAPHALLSF